MRDTALTTRRGRVIAAMACAILLAGCSGGDGGGGEGGGFLGFGGGNDDHHADADPLRITFSAGLACWPQDGADLSQMMRRADLRLSRAKLEGRNRVVVR